MYPLVVIRYYRPDDEPMCKEITRTAAMSTVNAAFFNGFTTELHFQVMVLASAILYIFLGVPFGICLITIPTVVVMMYLLIYAAHKFSASKAMEEVTSIPRRYMSSDSTGFWVAEVYEPVFDYNNKINVQYNFVSEADVSEGIVVIPKQHKRTVIGTIGLVGDLTDHIQNRSSWIRNLAVLPMYQRRGVASALLKECLDFATARGYRYVTLATSECHHAGRMFFLKKGFDVKQTYHKHIFSTLVRVLKYELYKELRQNELNSSH